LEECEGHFARFAEKTFNKPRNLLMSLLTDSRYGSGDIEEALKEAFGVDRTLLEWSKNDSLTRKVAVTATTTDTSTPCIFANYSGEGRRLSNCGMSSGVCVLCYSLLTRYAVGYKLILPSDIHKIPIWEAYGSNASVASGGANLE
jgi:hypothetical protein